MYAQLHIPHTSVKLALANASRHVLLRSKVLEEVVCFYNVMLRNKINVQ